MKKIKYGLFCCLLALMFPAIPAVHGDEVPVHAPDRVPTQELPEGIILKDGLADIAVWEPGNLLLAVSGAKMYILTLPDLEVRTSAKIRGRAVACGFLRDISAERVQFFVVSSFNRDINTYFYEWTGSKIKRVGYDSSSFYRSVDGALLRQNVGRGKPFEGPVRVAILQGSRPRDASVLPLPKRTYLYTFVRGALWSDGIGVARVEGDARHLVIYRPDENEWEAVWESESPFGGSLTQVKGVDQEQSEEVSKGILMVDLDDQPDMEIMAASNIEAPIAQQIAGRRYDKSRVTAFDVRGRRAVTLWETDRLKGTIPNIAIWKDRWILPLVDPTGKKTRIYINPIAKHTGFPHSRE